MAHRTLTTLTAPNPTISGAPDAQPGLCVQVTDAGANS